MDPNTTWQELCKALAALYQHPEDNEQRERSIDCLDVLQQWLKQGGFPPLMDEQWNAQV